ncbi:MAG: VOC family protein [Gammaproteobacteria bacterium]|nr:VOC family protein [Gammaproteobacteria bacterium]MDH5802806.1 VOC family protein [Gammaproteobacteria bacterium]
MTISTLLHVSLLVADTVVSERFYQEIIGLEKSSDRPDLGYPGVWFELGPQQLHLIQQPNPDPVEGRPLHGGYDRHVAFAADDIEALIQRLEQHGISFTRSRSGRNALFLRDPDGNALEFVGG